MDIRERLNATLCNLARERAKHDTVEIFMQKLNCEYVIQRALTYRPGIRERLMKISVIWHDGLETSAGKFDPKRGILLHNSLRLSHPHNLRETFLHELAHAMQWLFYRELNHGATWWEMMHQLGEKPKRTHNIREVNGRMTDLDIMAKEMGLLK